MGSAVATDRPAFYLIAITPIAIDKRQARVKLQYVPQLGKVRADSH